MTVDLDYLEDCPTAERCAVCGGTARLRVASFETGRGVFCVTMCADCLIANRVPRLSPAEVLDRVLEHCVHLGIDPDEMARAVRHE